MHYRRICFFILLFGFIGASTVYSWDKEFFENIEQPIAFPHKLHVVNNGISCEYCHSSARNSVNAGIPPVRTCIGCHSLVKGRSEEQKKEIQKITDYWQKKEPIPWNENTRLTRFCLFFP